MSRESELRDLAGALREGRITPERASDVLETLSSIPDRDPTIAPSARAPEEGATVASDGAPDVMPTAMYVSSGASSGGLAGDLGGASYSATVRSYVAREEIARGGMGRVVLAHDPSIGRDVAIKEVHARILSSPVRGDRIERFLAEAQITGQLEHPCIVPIYDIGTKPDGAPYYAMKLVRGRTLSAAIKQYHELPIGDRRRAVRRQELLQALIGVCDAIAFAHSRGVLHRDLKPSNVMLGDFGEAILIDWGLARARGGRKFDDSALDDLNLVQTGARENSAPTMAGSMLGTPSYMPPEQALGEVDRIDERSDVFALGGLLYEILANRAPYVGRTKEETIGMAVARDLKPPRELAPDVPRALEAVCLKAMAKDPADRYPSAKALVEEIRRWQADEPVTAYPDPLWTRARRWARRHRVAASSVAAAGLALAIAAAGWRVYDDWRIGRLTDRAERSLAAGQAEFARRNWDAAARELAAAMALIETEPRLASLRSIGGELLEQANRSAQAERERAEAERSLDDFRRLRDQALFAGTLLVGPDLESSVRIAAEDADRALAIWDGGDRAALESAVAAAPLAAGEAAEARAGVFELLFALADAESKTPPGEPKSQQVEGARRALAILDRALAFGSPVRAFHERRARYLEQAGEMDAAARERREANGIEPASAVDFQLLGEDAFARGEADAARRWFERALRADPNRSAAQYMIAVCDLRDRRWREAIGGLTACESRGLDFVGIPLLRGFARSELGDIDGAEEEFREVESRRPEEYGLYLNRGVSRLRHGRFDQAMDDFRKALEIRPGDPGASINLAETHLLRKEPYAALDGLNAAIEAAPFDVGLRAARARVHLAKEDLQAAEADLRMAIEFAPSARLYAELGRLRHRRGAPGEALAEYERGAAIDPEYREIDRLTGLALVELGRPEEAVVRFSRFLEAPTPSARTPVGGDDDGRRRLAQTYRERGLARILAGDSEGAMGDFSRAAEGLESLKEVSSDAERGKFAIMLGRRGWSYLNEGPRLAQGDFDRILAADPGNSDALCGRSYARALCGDCTGAAADAEEALRRGPQHPGLTFNAACVYAECAARAAASADPRPGETSVEYVRRSVELLDESMRQCPAGRRKDHLATVVADRALDYLRPLPEFSELLGRWSMAEESRKP